MRSASGDDTHGIAMQALAAFQAAEKIKPDDRLIQERLRSLSKVVRARKGTGKPDAPAPNGTSANGTVRCPSWLSHAGFVTN